MVGTSDGGLTAAVAESEALAETADATPEDVIDSVTEVGKGPRIRVDKSQSCS